MPEGRYDASDIQVLDGIEAVRTRPQLYVGDTRSAETACRLVLEALCLAVDPKTGGPARRVDLRLLMDDIVEIQNDGPGLPLGRHGTENLSFVEIIMTRLYACLDQKDEVQSQKWCGLGIAALNALSEWCVVTVRRDGGVWVQGFDRGRPLHDLERRGDCDDTGTALRFKLDRTLLTGPLEAARLEAGLRQFTDEVPCTAVSFDDRRTGQAQGTHTD
jgi:DNA gyrase subunit B